MIHSDIVDLSNKFWDILEEKYGEDNANAYFDAWEQLEEQGFTIVQMSLERFAEKELANPDLWEKLTVGNVEDYGTPEMSIKAAALAYLMDVIGDSLSSH